MRINGLFGWVQHNDTRSVAFLLGFALLSQPMAMVVLFVPLVFLDHTHAPWYDWAGYSNAMHRPSHWRRWDILSCKWRCT